MPLQKKGFPMFPCDLKPTVNGVCKHVRKLPIIVMRIKDDVYSGTSTNHNDRISSNLIYTGKTIMNNR